MCAGLLLQDDDGSPLQHARGAPSLPLLFFSLWMRKALYFTFNPQIFVNSRTKEKLSQS